MIVKNVKAGDDWTHVAAGDPGWSAPKQGVFNLNDRRRGRVSSDIARRDPAAINLSLRQSEAWRQSEGCS